MIVRPSFLLLALALLPGGASAQRNAGTAPADAALPFALTTVDTFDTPWKLAFLPDGRLLVTEKPGKLWLVTPGRNKIQVIGVPQVAYSGQGGLLAVAVAPDHATSHGLYLTYAEPGPGGSGLALARAKLFAAGGRAQLTDLHVIWRQLPRGEGGQFGGYIAFAPDGRSLFLTSGERQRFTPAQDPDQALGKILHLTLDGKPAADNPGAGKSGAASVMVIEPPADTEAARTARGTRVTLTTPNLTPAETWTSGHRNPYGLAFDAKGRLWETEMGPKGGDELNLIARGGNYGWPTVSYGINYDGKPIASPARHPEFRQPALYWTPVIAPAGFTFYEGSLFPQWKGSAFIGSLTREGLVRVAFDGGPHQTNLWKLGHRIRDVVAGPDGALWLIEDEENGRLLRLTPKGATTK